MAKILIIDDSAIPRLVLRRFLEPCGHVIVEAANGATGLAKCAEEHPDLVLLDLYLGEESGFDVLAQLRAVEPDALVLICSGADDESTRARICSSSAHGFLPKPFVRDDVLQQIQRILRGDPKVA